MRSHFIVLILINTNIGSEKHEFEIFISKNLLSRLTHPTSDGPA
jgi:hypothetical protein